MDPDRRVRYEACDPLWHDVLTCPHCLYSNHQLSFFKVNSANRDQIKEALKEQHDIVAKIRHISGSPFDRLVLGYLQTIHLNERISPGNNTLTGILWLHLYWLGKDVSDERFSAYCAQNAADRLAGAIDDAQVFDVTSRCSIALSLANLLVYLGTPEKAKKYCAIAVKSPDNDLKRQALELKVELEINAQ